jgi:hypothetical protein
MPPAQGTANTLLTLKALQSTGQQAHRPPLPLDHAATPHPSRGAQDGDCLFQLSAGSPYGSVLAVGDGNQM